VEESEFEETVSKSRRERAAFARETIIALNAAREAAPDVITRQRFETEARANLVEGYYGA
jgi:hypothetical protein